MNKFGYSVTIAFGYFLWVVQSSALANPVNPTAAQIVNTLSPVPETKKIRRTRNLGVMEAESAEPANDPSSQAEPPGPPVRRAVDLAIQFEFGSSRRSVASRKTLGELVVALSSPELIAKKFRIEGHTDSKGNPKYNLKLSALRANEVRRYLVAHHIQPGRLTAVGKGASEPINDNDPTAVENRRVRIVSQEK